jgi:hypothetical protein
MPDCGTLLRGSSVTAVELSEVSSSQQGSFRGGLPVRDEREPVIEAGTCPLPYVQQGMMLLHETEEGVMAWVVEAIYANSHGGTVVQLRHTDTSGVVRRQVVPSEVCRAEYALLRDFDPNLA